MKRLGAFAFDNIIALIWLAILPLQNLWRIRFRQKDEHESINGTAHDK